MVPVQYGQLFGDILDRHGSYGGVHVVIYGRTSLKKELSAAEIFHVIQKRKYQKKCFGNFESCTTGGEKIDQNKIKKFKENYIRKNLT